MKFTIYISLNHPSPCDPALHSKAKQGRTGNNCKEILRWKQGYPRFSLLHAFRITLLVPCSTLFAVAISILFSNTSNFKLNCTGCANELYMDQLNQEFSEHEFRLLRVLNDQFMYVTIRKLSSNDSRSLHSFLDQSSAEQ